MKIPFSISNDDSENPIVYTLSHSKKFIYKKLKDLINLQGKKFIIIINDIEKKELKKLLKTFQDLGCFFLIPKELKNEFQKEGLETIIYPLQPEKIFNYFSAEKKQTKNNLGLILKDNGLLINTKNNVAVYLTETEMSIIDLLFKKRVVEKNLIREKILKFHESVNTKSLESHLSRIRKKIKKIDSPIKLISTNPNQIEIKFTNL